ncbi:MAG: redox-sensing transcriptional repressor Rex [Candidatus Omnitrophica bacterium]|nr:redox-sensing transcriptional repressor Rex [Candidatus Omnitrophota bacterium]
MRHNGRLHNGRPRRSIPEACVERLSLYMRELTQRQHQRVGFISSRRLAQDLGITDAQVRRDLSYFGQFGTSGRGYEVQRLRATLGRILGIQGRIWHVALAGVGNLGSALLAYQGFQDRGFVFRLAVDSDPQKVGHAMGNLTIEASHHLSALVQRRDIHIGMIAVPTDEAQAVCDQFIEGGVKAIVNFASARLDVPPSVLLRNVDLAIELEAMAFYLS